MTKKVVFCFGRFQPPTKGHALVINKTIDYARRIGGENRIYTSQSHDSNKNPLSFSQKIRFLKQLFPAANVMNDTSVRTAFEVCRKLSDEGYNHVVLVVGSDRVQSFRTQIGKYVKKNTDKGFDRNKHYNFDKFEVVSAGERDPDDAGVAGISGTKIREFIRNDDFSSFAKAIPTTNVALAKQIFNACKRSLHENTITEALDHKTLGPMVDSFVDFACDRLGIKSFPTVKLAKPEDTGKSFAAYTPHANHIMVVTKNRHPMDVFRSLAHELVHHKQWEEGRIGKDIRKEGETGSDIENEANAMAGVIMRDYAKDNPGLFGSESITESVVSRETREYSTYARQTPNRFGNKEVARSRKQKDWGYKKDDGSVSWGFESKKRALAAHKKYKERSMNEETQLTEGLNDPGNFKAVFLAGGPGSGKDYVLSQVLQGHGMSEINSDHMFELLMKKNNLSMKMPDDETEKREVQRKAAKDKIKKKHLNHLANRRGIIINGTADDPEKISKMKAKLEKMGYATKMVFVDTSDEVSAARNKERERSVPDDVRREIWQNAQKSKEVMKKMFGKDFHHLDNSLDLRKAPKEQKESKLAEFNKIWKHINAFAHAPVEHKAAQEWQSREMQNRGLSQFHKPKTYNINRTQRAQVSGERQMQASLGGEKRPEVTQDHIAQARRLGLSYYGFGRFGRNFQGKNTVTHTVQNGQLVAKQPLQRPQQQMREEVFKKAVSAVTKMADKVHKKRLASGYMTPAEKERLTKKYLEKMKGTNKGAQDRRKSHGDIVRHSKHSLAALIARDHGANARHFIKHLQDSGHLSEMTMDDWFEVDMIVNEEQLNELSKNKLKKYVSKSRSDMQSRSSEAAYNDTMDYDDTNDETYYRKQNNRQKGIDIARKKMKQKKNPLHEMMTSKQKDRREKIVKGMKKNKADLKARYGDRWKEVMYATATKNSVNEQDGVGPTTGHKRWMSAATGFSGVNNNSTAFYEDNPDAGKKIKKGQKYPSIKDTDDTYTPIGKASLGAIKESENINNKKNR